MTQGVYVVGVAHGEARNAFTAAWVTQVSFNPLLMALSIDPHHSSYRLLKENQAFSINVLKKGQLDLAEHFAQPSSTDKLAGQRWTMGRMGLPLLQKSAGLVRVPARRRARRRRPQAGCGKRDRGQASGYRSRAAFSYRETAAMDGAAALFTDMVGD